MVHSDSILRQETLCPTPTSVFATPTQSLLTTCPVCLVSSVPENKIQVERSLTEYTDTAKEKKNLFVVMALCFGKGLLCFPLFVHLCSLAGSWLTSAAGSA